MIGTIDIRVSAHAPQMPLEPLFSFVSSPSSIRILNVPKAIGDWIINGVSLAITYPDGNIKSKAATRIGNVWVATIEGTETSGKVTSGYQILASGIDENGNDVSGYVLGVGDVYILNRDSGIDPELEKYQVHYCEEIPDNPAKGDVVVSNPNGLSKVSIWNGEGWISTLCDAVYSIQGETLQEGDRKLTADCEILEWESVGSIKWAFSGEDGQTTILEPTENENEWMGYIEHGGGNMPLRLSNLGLYDDLYNWEIVLGQNVSVSYANTEEEYPDSFQFIDFWPFGDATLTKQQTGGYDWVQVDTLATEDQIPHNVSELENDVGYITSAELPTKTSDLVNDSGFITSADVPAVHNPTITLTQGGVSKGTFTLNQSTNKTIDLDAGGGGDSGITVSWFYYSDRANSNQSVVIGDTTIKYLSSINQMVINNEYFRPNIEHVSGVVKGETVPININCYGYDGDCVIIIQDEDGTTRYQQNVVKTLTKDTQIFINMSQCLESHTPILMADGTTKEIKNLSVGEKVMSLNPDTMELEDDIVVDCDGGVKNLSYEKDVWTFSDGTTISTIHPHQFFNVRLGRMEYIANFQIGDEVLKSDGSKTSLVSHAVEEGIFFHNTLFTEKFNNYFANGVLSGNRHSKKFGWYWIEQHN